MRRRERATRAEAKLPDRDPGSKAAKAQGPDSLDSLASA
jgi:hypothetical protein